MDLLITSEWSQNSYCQSHTIFDKIRSLSAPVRCPWWISWMGALCLLDVFSIDSTRNLPARPAIVCLNFMQSDDQWIDMHRTITKSKYLRRIKSSCGRYAVPGRRRTTINALKATGSLCNKCLIVLRTHPSSHWSLWWWFKLEACV